jgi:hypothetical protein
VCVRRRRRSPAGPRRRPCGARLRRWKRRLGRSAAARSASRPALERASGVAIPERPEADRQFYQQVYFHKLGTDWRNDPLALGTKDGLPRVAEIFLGSENNRNLIVATVQNGDGGEFAHFLITPGSLRRLSDFKDKIVEVKASAIGELFALSRADAPNGKIVKLEGTNIVEIALWKSVRVQALRSSIESKFRE